MKKYNIVKLINLTEEYKSMNLYEDIYGVVLEEDKQESTVMFFNQYDLGDYAIVKVNNISLLKTNEYLPKEFIKEFDNKLSKLNMEKKKLIEKKYNESDIVRLIVEDENYAKYGVHKGAVGCVAVNYAINNEILVDFTDYDPEIDDAVGDCISVKCEHIELVE